ncbi:ABC transporter permease [Bacteroidota bacterium]
MKIRLRAIAKKEIKQLLRDKRMLFVIFFFPVLLLVVFGYAVNFDVQNIQIAVYDLDNSKQSRSFINSLSSTPYFIINKYLDNYDEANEILDQKIAQVVIVIPEDFSKDISRHKEPAKLQFLIDGVDGNTANIIRNYVIAATYNLNIKLRKESKTQPVNQSYSPIDLKPVFWFNPNLETTKFLMPGLIALILIVTSVITVSLTLVREKERGTIEQIKVSSINTIELLLGKSLPYLCVALINAGFILIAGYILFNVEVKGSFFHLLLCTFIFLFACTSMGILISVVSESQQVAFSLSTFFSLLPSVILSGFIFPIESMPTIIQIITNITPTKFFLVTLRAIVLKGVGLHAFWEEILYLLLFGFVLLFLAAQINKRNLKNS